VCVCVFLSVCLTIAFTESEGELTPGFISENDDAVAEEVSEELAELLPLTAARISDARRKR
jgi:hypothetical protein